MRYNVAQLLKGTTGGFRKYDLTEEIRNLDPELRPLRPLTGSVILMRTSQGDPGNGYTGDHGRRRVQEVPRARERCG